MRTKTKLDRPVHYNFDTNEDWLVCKCGKLEISHYRYADKIHRLKYGRVVRFRDEAREYLKAHEKLDAAYREWYAQRCRAIDEWKHNTPHYRYECDAGSVAVRVNGAARLLVNNGEGDGNRPVYILDGYPPPFFYDIMDVTLHDCTIEVLDYDCTGGKPLCDPIEIKRATFWRDGNGAVAIACERKGAD